MRNRTLYIITNVYNVALKKGFVENSKEVCVKLQKAIKHNTR